MDKTTRMALQFKLDSLRRVQLAATGGEAELRVEPTRAYPVDKLLPGSHLQGMKKLLELADARSQRKALAAAAPMKQIEKAGQLSLTA